MLLTWKIWLVSNNASKWQVGFNSAFKGLKNISPPPPQPWRTAVPRVEQQQRRTHVTGHVNSETGLIVTTYKDPAIYILLRFKQFKEISPSTAPWVLCYKLECRWSDPSWCQWIFH